MWENCTEEFYSVEYYALNIIIFIAVWTLCWERDAQNAGERKVKYYSLTEVQPPFDADDFSKTYTQYFDLRFFVFAFYFFTISWNEPYPVRCAFVFNEIDHGRFLKNHHFDDEVLCFASFKHSLD